MNWMGGSYKRYTGKSGGVYGERAIHRKRISGKRNIQDANNSAMKEFKYKSSTNTSVGVDSNLTSLRHVVQIDSASEGSDTEESWGEMESEFFCSSTGCESGRGRELNNDSCDNNCTGFRKVNQMKDPRGMFIAKLTNDSTRKSSNRLGEGEFKQYREIVLGKTDWMGINSTQFYTDLSILARHPKATEP